MNYPVNMMDAMQYSLPKTYHPELDATVNVIPHDWDILHGGTIGERLGRRKVNGEWWLLFLGNTDIEHLWHLEAIDTKVWIDKPVTDQPDISIKGLINGDVGKLYVPEVLSAPTRIVTHMRQPATDALWYCDLAFQIVDSVGGPTVQLAEAFYGGLFDGEKYVTQWYQGAGPDMFWPSPENVVPGRRVHYGPVRFQYVQQWWPKPDYSYTGVNP